MEHDRRETLIETESVLRRLVHQKKLTPLEWFVTVCPIWHELETSPPGQEVLPRAQAEFTAVLTWFFDDVAPRLSRRQAVDCLCAVVQTHQRRWNPLPQKD